MKRFYIIILSISLALALCSCSIVIHRDGDDTSEAPVTTSEPQTDDVTRVPDGSKDARAEAAARVASLPDRKPERDSFIVAVAQGITLDPATITDGYDAALADRCAMVADKYGIKIGQIETPLELMLSDCWSAYLAGVYYADAMMIPQSAVGDFEAKGFLLRSQSLPFIDYSKEYFDRGAMDQSSAGRSSPVIAGALTKDVGSYYCMYVNTALLSDGAFADVRSSVRDGSWTWDKLIETARESSGVNGGIGAVGAGTADILVDTVFASTGQNYFLTGQGAVPKIAYSTEPTQNAVNILSSLYGGTGVLFNSYLESGDELDAFRKGSALFHADTVGNMAKIAEMGGDWCALPVPKISADGDDYYTACSADAPVMVMTADTPAPDDAAYIIDALNAASYKYVDLCYYDRLINTAVNNSITLDMLDYVCGIKAGKGIYDFTKMYASRVPEITGASSGALWELAVNGGDLASKAASASYSVNWRLVNAFPEK